ncbi:hypothetical protein XENTR_v10021532 [Xenopus tropicalis]|nr:hypothetical protein XENTR_v10021532 [Xenopus tropicalis]
MGREQKRPVAMATQHCRVLSQAGGGKGGAGWCCEGDCLWQEQGYVELGGVCGRSGGFVELQKQEQGAGLCFSAYTDMLDKMAAPFTETSM